MMLKLPKQLSMNLLSRKFLPAPETDGGMTRIEDALRFLVKVCGVANEEEVETALEAGANAIGFNFCETSPRYIEPARARKIVQNVRGSYLKVGVFVNPSEDELLHTAGLIPLNVLQLHGDSAPFHLARSLSVWKAVNPDAIPEHLSDHISAWLLDTPSAMHGGSGRTFDWSLAANFPARAIIAGGLEGANVINAIQIARPWGVDACSRLESSPGVKDCERIKDFVQAAVAGFRLHQEEKAS